MKKQTIIPIIALMATLSVGLVLMSFMQAKAKGATEKLPLLETSILKVGQADVIILTEGKEAMVIDAGEEEDGVELVETLTEKGITQVETLIITHYDKDHVGGADVLLEQMQLAMLLTRFVQDALMLLLPAVQNLQSTDLQT